MTTYSYKARDKQGKLIEGKMDGDSDRAVATKLKQMNCTPILISKAKKYMLSASFFFRFKSVSLAEVNLLTRQLFTLQKAGLPLLSSLNALKKQTANINLKNAIEQIARDIEGGSSFSDALARHPQMFNSIYTNLIRSGEASGKMAETLERLAQLGEHEEKVRMRIKAATRYPSIVVTAIIIGFLILITFVIPRFAKVYSQFNAALPIPTQILIGINYVVTKFWWLVLGIIAVAVFVARQFIKTSAGRLMWDTFKFRIPVFGPLVQKIIMSRFARVTSMLMSSGVPILQILDLVTESTGNVLIARTIQKIKKSVSEGKGMYEPMEASGLFPPVVTEMIAVGEKTGKIDVLLLHVSEYYDVQIDYTIDNFLSLIEPILIFILGCSVLLMALGILLPMWNLINVFKK